MNSGYIYKTIILCGVRYGYLKIKFEVLRSRFGSAAVRGEEYRGNIGEFIRLTVTGELMLEM